MSTTRRLIKVSSTGQLLPLSAKDWDGVYIPAAELTVARRILPIRGDFDLVGKACAQQDLCGAKAIRSISVKEWVNHLLEFDRTGPALDTRFFTIDDPWQWIWTCDPCAPRGFAFYVDLYGGYVARDHQSYLHSALPCRPGQILVPSATKAPPKRKAGARARK